jgi:hypothetical protein
MTELASNISRPESRYVKVWESQGAARKQKVGSARPSSRYVSSGRKKANRFDPTPKTVNRGKMLNRKKIIVKGGCCKKCPPRRGDWSEGLRDY